MGSPGVGVVVVFTTPDVACPCYDVQAPSSDGMMCLDPDGPSLVTVVTRGLGWKKQQ